MIDFLKRLFCKKHHKKENESSIQSIKETVLQVFKKSEKWYVGRVVLYNNTSYPCELYMMRIVGFNVSDYGRTCIDLTSEELDMKRSIIVDTETLLGCDSVDTIKDTDRTESITVCNDENTKDLIKVVDEYRQKEESNIDDIKAHLRYYELLDALDSKRDWDSFVAYFVETEKNGMLNDRETYTKQYELELNKVRQLDKIRVYIDDVVNRKG